jgi:uncharacterized membrane protein
MTSYLFLVPDLALERIFEICLLLSCALGYSSDKIYEYMRHTQMWTYLIWFTTRKSVT